MTSGRAVAAAAALLVVGIAIVLAFGWWPERTATPPTSESFRLLVLGGSTALGEPYTPYADVGKLAALCLQGQVAGLPLAVELHAGPGRTAPAGVEVARRVATRRESPRTAAAFLYLGNNEFLGFDRRHDLRKQERQLVDAPAVTAEDRRKVLERYRAAIEQTIELLQDGGYRVIASTAAVNQRDWEPNRSVIADPAHADSVGALMARGEQAAAEADWPAARAAFETVLRLEPEFALACKRAADCALVLGDIEAARRGYQNAVDFDANPYRELSSQNEILRRVCKARDVPVLEAQAILDALSSTGIAGDDVFWDNCHPRLEGYVALAHALATELAPRGTTLVPVDSVDAARRLGIDAKIERSILNSRGQYCYAAATLVYDPRARLRRSHLYLERASQLDPRDADVLCSRAVLAAMEDSLPRSLAHWRAAMAIDPQLTRERMANKHVVAIMQRRGVNDLAAQLR